MQRPLQIQEGNNSKEVKEKEEGVEHETKGDEKGEEGNEEEKEVEVEYAIDNINPNTNPPLGDRDVEIIVEYPSRSSQKGLVQQES